MFPVVIIDPHHCSLESLKRQYILVTETITNGYLLDLLLMSGYSKVLSEQSLDSDKRCC